MVGKFLFLQNTPCTKGLRKQAWLRKCPTFLKHWWGIWYSGLGVSWQLCINKPLLTLRCWKCFLLGRFSWNFKHLFGILLVQVAAWWHLWWSVFSTFSSIDHILSSTCLFSDSPSCFEVKSSWSLLDEESSGVLERVQSHPYLLRCQDSEEINPIFFSL